MTTYFLSEGTGANDGASCDIEPFNGNCWKVVFQHQCTVVDILYMCRDLRFAK